MAQIRGVLFDKDGTLFDFNATWSDWAERLFQDLSGGDGTLAEALARAAGYDLALRAFDPESPVIAGTPDEVASILLPHLPQTDGGRLVARMNALAASAPLTQAVPLAPLLARLRAAGLSLGVATNDAEAPALAHLEMAMVAPFFDFVAGSDSGHGAKPDPGPLLAFARATGLRPAEVVMVGDSTHDLLAGRAAGMACVAVLTGPAGRADLAPYADAVLPDIGHLPGWLGLG